MLNKKKSLSILVQRLVCQVLKILLILKTNKKESTKVGFNYGFLAVWLNKKDNDKVKENEKITCESQVIFSL